MGESALCRRNIQQAAHSVVVRLESRVIRLGGGLEKCDGCLALTQGSVQVGICRPDLIRNLIALDLGLCFSLTNVSARL